MSEVWTRDGWCKGIVGHPESNEEGRNGWERTTGNRLGFPKQNSHRAGIVPFPCRLLSDLTIPQVMHDVPHDVSHKSLVLRCCLWNRTKHYVYCNKCRGGGECDLGQREKGLAVHLPNEK